MTDVEQGKIPIYIVTGAELMLQLGKFIAVRDGRSTRIKQELARHGAGYPPDVPRVLEGHPLNVCKVIRERAASNGLYEREYTTPAPLNLESGQYEDRSAIDYSLLGILVVLADRTNLITGDSDVSTLEQAWPALLDRAEGIANYVAEHDRALRATEIDEFYQASRYGQLPDEIHPFPFVVSPLLARRIHAGIDIVGEFVLDALTPSFV